MKPTIWREGLAKQNKADKRAARNGGARGASRKRTTAQPVVAAGETA
jgi:hypothetical protein